MISPGDPEVQSSADGNILKNGGFEESGSGAPPGWVVEPKIAGQGQISVVTDHAQSGKASLKLAPNRRNKPNGTGDGPLRVAQGFPAESFHGKKLFISADMSAEGGATAIVGALILRSKGMPIMVELRQDSSKPGFVHQQDMLAVPDAGDIKILVVGCSVEGTSGAAYYDNVYVGTRAPAEATAGQASGVNETAPAAHDKSQGALNASIAVYADRELRPIPPTLYGTNAEWIWNANGLWDTNRKEINQETVRLTRELGVTLIRFPGGVFANYYHWKDGVGPQASRRETEHTPGGPKSVHLFGTDEALSFAEQTGSHLMITVNASTGTPQEAADWVRYVNGKNSPERRVDYWEIGNELYVSDSALTPARYASRFIEFARAMRAVDPNIKLGAIADDNYGRTIPHKYPDWAERVLSDAGSEIDFLSIHNGYAPILATDGGWDTRTVYSAMLAAPVLMARSLDEVAGKIQRFAPTRAGHIKLAVTEWGPLFQGTPKDRFVDHVKTLASGLFVADALKTFIESPQTDIANFFKLVDPLYAGWIGLRNGQNVPTGPYYAFEMYTRHFGDVAVKSEVESPAYRSVSVGWVDAVQSVPYLDVISSRSGEGHTVYLLAINKNFDEPVRARIHLRGFQPRGKATAWVLNGAGIDANTGTSPVAVPGIKWARQAVDERNPHFERGGAGEIELTSSPLEGAAESFEYTFPAHSVTSLEIGGRRK